jgi:hypothetical protein
MHIKTTWRELSGTRHGRCAVTRIALMTVAFQRLEKGEEGHQVPALSVRSIVLGTTPSYG